MELATSSGRPTHQGPGARVHEALSPSRGSRKLVSDVVKQSTEELGTGSGRAAGGTPTATSSYQMQSTHCEMPIRSSALLCQVAVVRGILDEVERCLAHCSSGESLKVQLLEEISRLDREVRGWLRTEGRTRLR
jgi:hypothetical protein